MSYINETGLDKVLTKAFFTQLKDIEGIDEYLKMTMDLDIRKFFEAPDNKSQDQLKGHYSLAKYLYSGIVEARK